jgi:nitroimidazol reductase NimA-like FMN-containing flavoprotein (pyridoxamine 5'-phosphate oxidase superfamily)
VGRVVFVGEDGLPAAYPVNFVTLEDAVAFRTDRDGSLAAAVDGAAVNFEADSYDGWQRTGWSVMVAGRAEPVHDRAVLAAVGEAGLFPWSPGQRDQVIRIPIERISGRRIERPADRSGRHD